MTGGDWESRLKRLELILDGNGRPGLVEDFRDFVSRWEERETIKERADKEREKEQDRREKKFNRTVAIIGVLLTALGVIAVFLTMYFKSLEAKHVVSSQATSVRSTQDATVPPSLR